MELKELKKLLKEEVAVQGITILRQEKDIEELVAENEDLHAEVETLRDEIEVLKDAIQNTAIHCGVWMAKSLPLISIFRTSSRLIIVNFTLYSSYVFCVISN